MCVCVCVCENIQQFYQDSIQFRDIWIDDRPSVGLVLFNYMVYFSILDY